MDSKHAHWLLCNCFRNRSIYYRPLCLWSLSFFVFLARNFLHQLLHQHLLSLAWRVFSFQRCSITNHNHYSSSKHLFPIKDVWLKGNISPLKAHKVLDFASQIVISALGPDLIFWSHLKFVVNAMSKHPLVLDVKVPSWVDATFLAGFTIK